jgi:hypothetical protein
VTLYTLGVAKNYDRVLSDWIEGRCDQPRKIGKESAGRAASVSYPGGSVWPSLGGVRLYLDQLANSGQIDPSTLGVYEVSGDWDGDTEPDSQPDANWRNLLYDRPIVRRIE